VIGVGDAPALGARRRVGWMPRGVIGRLAKNRAAVLGTGIIGAVVLVALVGPRLTSADPIAMNLTARLQPPSAAHLLGTDGLGRDILSRIVSGAAIALEVGGISVGIAGTVGIALGLIAGFYGRFLDTALMSVMDVLLAFPSLLLALLVVTALGPSLTNAMIAVAVSKVPQFVRLIRATVLSVKENDYVLAARAVGAGDSRIMTRHVLVNCLAPVIVHASLSFGTAIVAAATLSFLGLGSQPPAPEWGSMLNEGREYMRAAPWVATFPGLAILITVIGWNLFGDGLRDALDPRLKR
jgi:peptide/nickel transport system permease protein